MTVTPLNPRPYPRADRFHVWYCADPACGPHILAYDEAGKIMCETVMSPAQAADFMGGFVEALVMKVQSK